MKRRQWLIDIRNNLGYTQEQLAEIVGIERSTYTKAENGSPVGVRTAKKIASATNSDWTLFFESECDVEGQKQMKPA